MVLAEIFPENGRRNGCPVFLVQHGRMSIKTFSLTHSKKGAAFARSRTEDLYKNSGGEPDGAKNDNSNSAPSAINTENVEILCVVLTVVVFTCFSHTLSLFFWKELAHRFTVLWRTSLQCSCTRIEKRCNENVDTKAPRAEAA